MSLKLILSVFRLKNLVNLGISVARWLASLPASDAGTRFDYQYVTLGRLLAEQEL
jgi:hypothetical protein